MRRSWLVQASEAGALVAVLKAAFPRQEVPEETMRLYAEQLVDLDLKAGEAAISKLLHTSRFFPTIAEIRAAANEARYGVLPTPGEAWQMAAEADWGNNWEPKEALDLPHIVKRAFDIVGGGERFRLTEHMYAMRGDFLRVYADLREATLLRSDDQQRRAMMSEQELPEGIDWPELTREMPEEEDE
jgi:hypothetical protein